MALSKFDILDLAVKAGGVGTALSGTALGGGGKHEKELRKKLSEEGFLTENKNKFSLTPAGEAEWRKEAPPERIAEEEARKAEARAVEERRLAEAKTEAVALFVGKVESKKGKPFTEGELLKFPVELREESMKREYVGAGSTAESFIVLPKGETFLLSRRPIEEQVAGLHRLYEVMTTGLHAIKERIGHEVVQLGEDASALRTAATEFAHEITAAGHKFEKVIGEIGAYGKLVSAAKHFKEILESKSQHQPVLSTNFEPRLHDLKELIAKRNSDFEALSRTLHERLEAVSKKLAELAAPSLTLIATPERETNTTPASSEPEITATA